jgi:hypothetical protein
MAHLVAVHPYGLIPPVGINTQIVHHVNPLNVVLIRQVFASEDTEKPEVYTELSEILFVNTVGQQSSMVVTDSIGYLRQQLDASLRVL